MFFKYKLLLLVETGQYRTTTVLFFPYR